MATVLEGLKSADYTSTIDVYDTKNQESTRYYVHTQYVKPSSVRISISDIAMDDKDASMVVVDGGEVSEYSPRDNTFAHGPLGGTAVTLPNGVSGAKPVLGTLNALLGPKPFADVLIVEEGGLPLTIKRTGLDIPEASLITSHTEDAYGVEHNAKIWVSIQDMTPKRIVYTNINGDSETEVYHEDFLTFKKNPTIPDSTFKWSPPDGSSELTPPVTGDPIKPGQLGATSPEFTLNDRSGEAVSFAEYHGRVVVIVFWSSASPQSVAELDHLQKIYDDLSSKGLAILAINTMEDGSARERFLSKKKFTFDVLVDDKGYSKSLFGVEKLPTTFLVGRDGIVSATHVGFDNVGGEGELRSQIATLKIR
jgi:peroxiredoxin/outer membrane lipoprotein-sorting protein